MAWNPETKIGQWLKSTANNIGNGISSFWNRITGGNGAGGLLTNTGRVLGSAVSGLGEGIVGPLGDMLFRLGDRQRAYDKQERELEYLRSLPSTQMENLAAAGLNPNLIYGNGASGAAGNYTPNEDKGYGISALGAVTGTLGQIMNTIGGFQQIKAVSAGIDKTREAARTAALKNDAQEYLNDLMGIYTYLPDGRRVVQKSHIDVDPKTGKVVAVGNVTPKLAQVVQGLNKAYMSNAITEEELKTVVGWLAKQRAAEFENTQASTGYLNTQASYTAEQLRRLESTWDPNLMRLLDLGESLAGDAATIMTRGIAGKKGLMGSLHDEQGFKSTPKGYYSYGRYFR